MASRLISFLGLGGPIPPHYNPVRYEWNKKISDSTPLLEKALRQLIPDINQVTVLGTAKVRECWIQTGLFQKLYEHEPHFIEVPDGKELQEYWSIFDSLLKELETPHENVDHIYLDITHGYRSQGILGLSALFFRLADIKRNQSMDLGKSSKREFPQYTLLYGAYEARKVDGKPCDEKDRNEHAIAPVWDLTALLEAVAWNEALTSFYRYGRADSLDEQCQRLSERLRGPTAKSMPDSKLDFGKKKLGPALHELSNGIVTNRVHVVLQKNFPEVAGLLSEDNAESRHFLSFVPPVQERLTSLVALKNEMSCYKLLSHTGLVAWMKLARQAFFWQRYMECATLLREALVTHYSLLELDEKDLLEPGVKGHSRQRNELERKWSDESHSYRKKQIVPKTEHHKRNYQLSGSVTQLRNDFAHCGLNDQPRDSKSLLKSLQDVLQKCIQLAEDYPLFKRTATP